ncbi:enhancer of filamentation 1-like [Ctenocephalides felis]|uniref:enhancer of filamentation 1-like n=1 Tax=Ctenocephalides felis TaxID=7515 RepID=UPI000E6E4799|nr:enhancer of filamentation 1-like [Ctenocephalides felis]
MIQMCIARALYDNIAESPDELAFRRGDQLTVLEQNTNGLEGWWLCSLRGRQGICPGNRLRILAGVYETPPTTPVIHQQTEFCGERRSWHVQPNRVVTPQRRGDVYVYENPSAMTRNSPIDCYDTPRPIHHSFPTENYDTPRHSPSTPHLQQHDGCYNVPRHSPSVQSLQETMYNIPRQSPSIVQLQQDTTYNVPRQSPCTSLPHDSTNIQNGVCKVPQLLTSPVVPESLRQSPMASMHDSIYNVPRHSPSLQQDNYDVPRSVSTHLNRMTPSSSVSSLTTDSLSICSNRSSLVNMPEYDVPRSLSVAQIDLPPAPKELPLELSSALYTLTRLQTEVTCATTILLGYVVPDWRRKDKLESTGMDIKLSAIRLKTALYDLVEFCEGVSGNAAKASDKGISQKIKPLVKTLKDAYKIIEDSTETLDALGWFPELEATVDRPVPIYPNNVDPLDELIRCARSLTEDVRLAVSSIQGNATLLFKRSNSPQNDNNNGNWMEDYDYINLDVKNNQTNINDESEDRRSSTTIDGDVTNVSDTINEEDLDCNDRQIVTFYAKQAVIYMANLANAIDAFLQTVERNQPPKIFLAYGKFVVLSAHRLVHIGDTVHRNVLQSPVKDRGLNCANALSEALAVTVNKTKIAAVQFPSVSAVQEMVDSVVDISHIARDLKLILLQASNI